MTDGKFSKSAIRSPKGNGSRKDAKTRRGKLLKQLETGSEESGPPG